MAAMDQFRGIPMDVLIGGPLQAACTAQYNLAKTMVTFINLIGFKDGQTVTVDFELERPVDDGSGVVKSETITVHAPLLGLVPIPALLIETVDINFSMEVSSHTEDKSKTEASVEVKYDAWYSPVSVTGKVSTSRENTRTTDNSAKYNVNVVARQQPPQEGMSKLMDLMASAVEPIKVEQKAAA